MYALSIKEPWTSLILHFGKDTENRTWLGTKLGQIVLCSSLGIDLGKKDRQDDWEYLQEYYEERGVHLPRNFTQLGMRPGYALGLVTITGYDKKMRSVWDEPDQWHFRLADPIPFKNPFHVRGQLGFFKIADELLPPALHSKAVCNLLEYAP